MLPVGETGEQMRRELGEVTRRELIDAVGYIRMRQKLNQRMQFTKKVHQINRGASPSLWKLFRCVGLRSSPNATLGRSPGAVRVASGDRISSTRRDSRNKALRLLGRNAKKVAYGRNVIAVQRKCLESFFLFYLLS